jgi:hypothetical protein
VFFILNVLFLSAGVILYLYSYYILLFVLGIMMLISLSANLTSYMDCSSEMDEHGEDVKGLPCPECDFRNTVYPWSL